MTKSRAEELNPVHKCTECGIEHFFIQPMNARLRTPTGERVDVPLIPLEIVLVAEGLATFTTDEEPRTSSKVPVVGILWGVPDNPQLAYKSVMVMN